MPTQPKLLTVILASNDLARTYSTLHSVQALRYRNHEIICLVPPHLVALRNALRRDFNWMPVLTAPYASMSTLLTLAVEYGQQAFVDGFFFVQAGTSADPELLHIFSGHMAMHPAVQLFLPTVLRADGRSAVYGGVSHGRYPYQLQARFVDTKDENPTLENLLFVGGAYLMRARACYRLTTPYSADHLALLFWAVTASENNIKSCAFPDMTVLFDGPLFSDFLDGGAIPDEWYREMSRYIATMGSWYDVQVFRWRCAVRRLRFNPFAKLWEARALANHR